MRYYTVLSECDATTLNHNAVRLRWAGRSDVQIHEISLKVSEPLEVPVKIPLHLSLQESLQIPVQEASLPL